MNAKVPNSEQSILIRENGLLPDDWFVIHEDDSYIHLVSEAPYGGARELTVLDKRCKAGCNDSVLTGELGIAKEKDSATYQRNRVRQFKTTSL